MKYRFLILSMAIISGCGVKGGPYPPLTDSPATVENAFIKQQGDELIVYWNYFPRYADGRKMKENFRFRIYTLEHKILKKIYNRGNLYWFRYKFKEEKEYCFRFKVFTKNNESRFSRYFCYIPTFNFPKVRPEFFLELVENGIKLNWNSFTRINIYRDEKKRYYPLPYKLLQNKNSFTDKKVKENQIYCYYLTFENKIGVEGFPSDIKCITYRDIFPPLPPLNPTIIRKNATYYLIWSDSPSKDVIGYIIEIDKKVLTPKPIKSYIYKLRSYKPGQTIKIYAVDKAGNKSKPAILKLSNEQF